MKFSTLFRTCLPFLMAFVVGSSVHEPEDGVRAVVVARNLEYPWALAFLPDGRMLVTERPGRIRIVGLRGDVSKPLAGVPVVASVGRCGLLDLALDPAFAENRLAYWTFAESSSDGALGVAVARGRLDGDAGGEVLADVRVIFRQTPVSGSHAHCGSRLVFDRQGHLWVGLGDRLTGRDRVQGTDNHLGKVVRVDRDGKTPPDNPFVDRRGALHELWSIGHRNIQGMAMHPDTGELWATEHGPDGGDELNVVMAGRNYGWPLVTSGREYDDHRKIGEAGARPGIEMPIWEWLPVSVAPSGLAFITSDRYADWKGSLLVGTLRAQVLIRLQLHGTRVSGEERLLGRLNQRIRDVRQGPDGWLYVLTDSAQGKIIRLER